MRHNLIWNITSVRVARDSNEWAEEPQNLPREMAVLQAEIAENSDSE